MRRFKECPICFSHNCNTLVSMDKNKIVRLKNFDDKYYQGFLSKISFDIGLKLQKCKICNHIFWFEIPSEENISLIYNVHAEHKKN